MCIHHGYSAVLLHPFTVTCLCSIVLLQRHALLYRAITVPCHYSSVYIMPCLYSVVPLQCRAFTKCRDFTVWCHYSALSLVPFLYSIMPLMCRVYSAVSLQCSAFTVSYIYSIIPLQCRTFTVSRL